MLKTLIANKEKESLETDRLKRETAEKEAEIVDIQKNLKDYDPEEIKNQKKF